jgi:hypothetical protein
MFNSRILVPDRTIDPTKIQELAYPKALLRSGPYDCRAENDAYAIKTSSDYLFNNATKQDRYKQMNKATKPAAPTDPLKAAPENLRPDLLLNAGADIDARDVDHRASPAEWMLDRSRDAGRYDLARYLVERGAHADIFMAAALGLTDRAVALLRAGTALLDEQTGRGVYAEMPPSSFHMYFWTIGSNRSPLDVAAQFGHDDTLAAMRAFATPVQQLRLACRRTDTDAARALVQEHPGLVASLRPQDHRAITDAAWDGDAPAVALMLELGFDPATPGHDSGTALHCASWQGSAATVAVLLTTPQGRALLTVRDAHHQDMPLGWCRHGATHGPRGGDHAAVETLLLTPPRSSA